MAVQKKKKLVIQKMMLENFLREKLLHRIKDLNWK